MNKQIIPIISVGHGGMIAGEYQTKGKQHTYENGVTIYEGEFNRAIKNRVCERLNFMNIPYYDLVPENKDISRMQKVRRANLFTKGQKAKGNETFLIEIHANAGGGEGCESFVCNGASKKSHLLAECIEENYNIIINEKWRGQKVKDWTILKYTSCPAVLLECFFMDNEKEVDFYLLNKHGRDLIDRWVTASLLSYRAKEIISNFMNLNK